MEHAIFFKLLIGSVLGVTAFNLFDQFLQLFHCYLLFFN